MGRLRSLAKIGDESRTGRAIEQVGEFARKEVALAFPAAKRAAGHAARAFLKKFSEEYARERKKKR